MVEISSIVGTVHGLGVENLMGSGLIAGEPSAAFDKIFTLTYVVARSVGIGAKLGSPWAAGYPEGKRRDHNSQKFLSAKQRSCSRRLLEQ
jgi:Carboxyl transferase domain